MEDLNKLRWQCRRGTLELDIILENYLMKGYALADNREKAAFKKLLALEDNELLPYLMGDRSPIADDLAVLVSKIRKLAPARD